jgi:hypothetical protein
VINLRHPLENGIVTDAASILSAQGVSYFECSPACAPPTAAAVSKHVIVLPASGAVIQQDPELAPSLDPDAFPVITGGGKPDAVVRLKERPEAVRLRGYSDSCSPGTSPVPYSCCMDGLSPRLRPTTMSDPPCVDDALSLGSPQSPWSPCWLTAVVKTVRCRPSCNI